MAKTRICETDGQLYVRCTACNQYVIEGEFGGHQNSCRTRPATHPIKELEILLNAGVEFLDSGEDNGTDNACDCISGRVLSQQSLSASRPD